MRVLRKRGPTECRVLIIQCGYLGMMDSFLILDRKIANSLPMKRVSKVARTEVITLFLKKTTL